MVPDDHPLSLGGIGLLGTAPAIDAMEGCDTLFMVGTNFPYTKYLPEPGQCKVVQIEADPIRAGNRIATDVPMIGDAAAGLSALLPHLAEQTDRSFLEGPRRRWASWRERMHALESIDEDPIQPQYLMHVIDRLADRRRHLDVGLRDDRHLGGPALHHPGRARRSICRETSPPWLLDCRTRSPTRSPTRVASASPSSVTGGSRC